MGPDAGASDFKGLSFDRLPGASGGGFGGGAGGFSGEGGVGIRKSLLTAKSGFQELLEAADDRFGVVAVCCGFGGVFVTTCAAVCFCAAAVRAVVCVAAVFV